MWVFGENHILTKVIIKRIIGASLNYSDNLERKINSPSFSDKKLFKFNTLFFININIQNIANKTGKVYNPHDAKPIDKPVIFAWFYFDIKHIHL